MNLNQPRDYLSPPRSSTVTLLPSYSIGLHGQGQHQPFKSLSQLGSYLLTLLQTFLHTLPFATSSYTSNFIFPHFFFLPPPFLLSQCNQIVLAIQKMSFPGRQQLPVNGSRNNLTPYQNRLHLGNITSPRPSPSSGNNDLSQSSRSASMTSPIYSAQPRQFSQEQMSPVGQGFPPQHNIDPFQARPSLPYAPHQVINQSSPVFQNHYQDSLLGPTLQSRFNLPSATPSAINQATRSPQYPHPNSFAQPRLSSRLQASTSIDMWGVNVENSLLDRRFPNNNLQHSLNAGSFSPESLYSFGHRDQHIHPSDAFVPHPSALVGTHRPQQGIPMRIPLQNAEENAAKGEMISGATSMRVDASTGSEIFRRSTRERKPAQHFGHSSRSDELEDLVSRFPVWVYCPDG